MNIGQSHVSTSESVGQFLVIDSHQVQHCGMQVMNFCAILNGFVAEFIGCTVDGATLDPASGHPK